MEKSISKINQEFEHNYDLYQQSIYNFCVSKLGDTDEARYCFNDAFSVYYIKLRDGIEITHPRAFLYKCARNFISRTLQNKKRTSSKIVSFSQDNTIDDILPSRENAYEELEEPKDVNAEEFLQLCFSQMSSNEIDIYKARWVNGYTIKEMTQALGISESNAKVRSKRVKDKMRSIIIEEYEKRRP